MANQKFTVYATKQTRYRDERAMPGDKFTVDESEMPGLISSGRFSTEPPAEPEKEAKAEAKK